MSWTTVKAPGDIRAYRYGEDTKTLDVRMRDDVEYRYYNVHPSVVSHFRHASSKGDALDRTIRRHYKYRRTWPPEMISDDNFEIEIAPMTTEGREEWRERREAAERRRKNALMPGGAL